MNHSEIDDLCRIVFHHENVAGLEIAMDQSPVMRGLKPAARLHQDFNNAIDG